MIMMLVMVIQNYDDDIDDGLFVIIRRLQQSVFLVNFLCVAGMGCLWWVVYLTA